MVFGDFLLRFACFWSAMGDISLEDVKNENVDLVRTLIHCFFCLFLRFSVFLCFDLCFFMWVLVGTDSCGGSF